MTYKNDQISYGLSIKVNKNTNKRTINSNTTNIFKKFNIENSKPIHIPLETKFKLIKDQSPQ